MHLEHMFIDLSFGNRSTHSSPLYHSCSTLGTMIYIAEKFHPALFFVQRKININIITCYLLKCSFFILLVELLKWTFHLTVFSINIKLDLVVADCYLIISKNYKCFEICKTILGECESIIKVNKGPAKICLNVGWGSSNIISLSLQLLVCRSHPPIAPHVIVYIFFRNVSTYNGSDIMVEDVNP